MIRIESCSAVACLFGIFQRAAALNRNVYHIKSRINRSRNSRPSRFRHRASIFAKSDPPPIFRIASDFIEFGPESAAQSIVRRNPVDIEFGSPAHSSESSRHPIRVRVSGPVYHPSSPLMIECGFRPGSESATHSIIHRKTKSSNSGPSQRPSLSQSSHGRHQTHHFM